jgi:hypothetical protein
MLVKRKKPRDDVPTLHDLVEEHAAISETEPAAEGTAPDSAATARATEQTEQTRMRSAFEIAIEAMVSEILNRHMAKAHEEITRSVLAEVRARLHGGSRGTQTK